MKSEVMLELLEAAAHKLAVKVSYEPLAASVGIGGLCRVKGDYRVIIDKRATASERVATLATALSAFELGELELPVAVRDLLRFHEGSGRKLSPRAA